MTKLSFTMILLAIIYMVNSRSTTMNEGNEMSLSIEAKAYDHKSDTGIEGSLHLNNGQKSVSGEDNSEDDTSEDGKTKEDCEAPIVIAIVSVQPSKASYKHGEYIEYICAGGVPDVNAVMKQRCNNGKFEPEANIKCRVSCTDLPTISGNGTLSTGNDGIWNLGESVQLTCEEGYSVSGPTMSTCGNAGFTPSTLICQKVELCFSGVSNSSIIRNNQITASSYWRSSEPLAPYHARLFGSSGAGCWAAGTNQANEWIQVDYEQTKTVVGVVTQGRERVASQWVKSFNVLYRAEGSGRFEPILNDTNSEAKVFQGNTDMNTPVTNYFGHPITARYFRINVLTWNKHISLRFDFLLC